MQTVFQILDNLILLSFVGIGFLFVERSRSSLGEIGTHTVNGLCFGLIAFLVTVTPVELGDGATVDARAGPVILAGVLAGPIGGLLAACLGALARGFVGGSFAFSGMVVYFVYALIGIAIRHFRIVTPTRVATLRGIFVLAFASFCGASAMYFLIHPTARAVLWLQYDLPYILLANALSVVFAAMVIGLATNFLRKMAEVVELNETLSLAKRAGKFGIWDFDIRTGALKWDDRSQELHGVSPSTFTGTYEDWARNIHPDDLQVAQEGFAQAISSGKIYDSEYRVLLPDGGYRTIKGDAIVLRDGAGTALRIVGTNLDLSELRTTEAKLIEAQSMVAQSQKFEMIGQLTGGVAHDFNNLLAVILGNQELLKDQLQSNQMDLREAIAMTDASIEATQRGAELTQNMLAYARKARLTPVLTDLNKVVRETEKWLRRTIESRIEIETVLQAGLWPTLVDRVSLQSALVNLLVNARDAVAGSGQVTVETSNIRIEKEYAEDRNEDIPPGRYVMLAVTDTGTGIAPEFIDQIFDPFYTTKQIGKGSGLGLSMVQGFVKQSGGAIRAYSELGVGTSFKIYFPATQGASQVSAEEDDVDFPSAVQERYGKRILLVEDQEGVLTVLEKTLRGAGFDVVTAESGDEAFRIFRDDNQFDLVATDIVMPGELQGPSLAREIRSLRPDIRFIFLSGYASEATVHGTGLRPEDIRLMKPVSRINLLNAVQSALSDQQDN